MFDPQVDAALTALLQRLETEAPELATVLREGREKETPPEELLAQLALLLREQPQLATLLDGMAMEVMAPLRNTPEDIPAVVQPETGLPKLNPLYEAALAERLQFDGDTPEFRTGPMVEGMTPAVPVKTSARNPVAIGDMLGRASQDVQEEQQALRDEILGLLADPETAEHVYREAATQIALQEDQRTIQVLNSSMVELDGYKRGELASPREVSEPTGGELAHFTPAQESQAAWKFLSTTQGRRSALDSIREMIGGILRAEEHMDVEVSEMPPQRGKAVLASSSWSVQMGGEQAVQPRFAYIDVAAVALAQGLLEGYREMSPVLLEVTTVDTVDARRVGWAARLVPRDG